MKMILKDGTVLEGTPQEMAEYNRKNVVVTGTPKPKRVYARKKTAKLWTGEELYRLKQNLNLTTRALKRLFPGRTENAVYQMRHGMEKGTMKPYQIRELNRHIERMEFASEN